MSLKDLEKRLSEATGANFQLERDINEALGLPSVGCPPFTASVDAAIQLCERMLPGWRASIHLSQANSTIGGTMVHLTDMETDDDDKEPIKSGWQKTPALALCLAIVRALLSKGGASD